MKIWQETQQILPYLDTEPVMCPLKMVQLQQTSLQINHGGLSASQRVLITDLHQAFLPAHTQAATRAPKTFFAVRVMLKVDAVCTGHVLYSCHIAIALHDMP